MTYTNRSLAFVRTLLGTPAKYPSAAMAVSSQTIRKNPEAPPLRTVAWYETDTPWGNCALSVGDGLVVTYDRGRPSLRRYDAPVLGRYLGWSETIR